MKSVRAFLSAAMIAFILFMTSCSDDDTPATVPPVDNAVTQSIVQIAQGNDDLTILLDALTKFPNLVEALNSDGTYTVFAPTNDAFIALLGAIGQTELDDIPESVLERVLRYHVVTGVAAQSTDLSDGQEIGTFLSADDIVTVGISGSSVSINTAGVAIPDVIATNGVVHVVNQVLVPSLEASIVNTVVEPAYFNKDFTVLTEAVVTAGLLETLINRDASLTVFAPTNEAFADAGVTSLEGIDIETLRAVLQYHVLGAKVLEADLPETGSAVETLNGDFYLSINADGVFINGLTQVIATDIEAENGVVHVIDFMLEPASNNIVEIAVALAGADSDAEFTQLVAALTAVSNETSTDLIAALSGDGPFTVFAPTDEAFQRLYDAVGDENSDGSADISDLVEAVGLETIATVLQYHVLGGRVFSEDIPNALNGNTSVTLSPLAGGDWTLNSDFTITATDGALGLGLDDAGIIATDILATNGVIHVIDQVKLP
ncbi:MAG: fasciclin domain-containing protein [Ekhidna sp.]|nr:fasciclin domain-containing protein [Ekhidna sp.]